MLILRSEIGSIVAFTAPSKTVKLVVSEKIACVVIGENDRLVVVTLAVIVTEKSLFSGILYIGSCSAHILKSALFISVAVVNVEFWYTTS